jgi:LXG domain of WXG superfamily
MSLNMYLGETDAQTNNMNSICIEIIQSMELIKSSIINFSQALLLQGKTYRSAKAYMTKTYLPLVQGIIYLCEELIRQNDQYPIIFRNRVSSADVIEQEILEQIREINRLIGKMQEAASNFPLYGPAISIYKQLKIELEQKLDQLYHYNSITSNHYDTAVKLARSVMIGLEQIQDGQGFNSNTGTFSTKGMNLSWVSDIDQIHYTRKAKSEYGDYLEDHPGSLDKVITIIKYEESNPENVRDTNNFLDPLEIRDTIEIKYLMYTADEPYRGLALRYLGDLEIESINESGVYRSNSNTLSFNIEDDRVNERGPYFTFFHELGHAIDYNYAKENDLGTTLSGTFTSNKKTLAAHMYSDVEQRIIKQLEQEFEQPEFSDLTDRQKAEMIHNITDVFIHEGPTDTILSDTEESLYLSVQTQISNDLKDDEHNNASDVYGGVTVNEIVGKWGHHNNGYWIDEESEERVNEPNKEGFASYYGAMMIEESELRDSQLNSMDEFLPEAKEHMREMLKSMNEGEDE